MSLEIKEFERINKRIVMKNKIMSLFVGMLILLPSSYASEGVIKMKGKCIDLNRVVEKINRESKLGDQNQFRVENCNEKIVKEKIFIFTKKTVVYEALVTFGINRNDTEDSSVFLVNFKSDSDKNRIFLDQGSTALELFSVFGFGVEKVAMINSQGFNIPYLVTLSIPSSLITKQ